MAGVQETAKPTYDYHHRSVFAICIHFEDD